MEGERGEVAVRAGDGEDEHCLVRGNEGSIAVDRGWRRRRRETTHGVWLGKTDGKYYKVKVISPGTPWPTKRVDDHSYDIAAMKGGKMLWSGRSIVAKDGKTRTFNMNGTGADGKKFKAKIVYDKA